MIYRFGDYALDDAAFELRMKDAPVAVEPQVFNLLLMLIENRDHVVSKDELIDHVWQGRAVSDTALSSRIFALRRALGDSGETQTMVRTVSRRGFRFVAEVNCAEETPVLPLVAGPAMRQARLQGAVTEESSRPTATPVVVVLPFKNASAGLDPFFCDGLTEDVISSLTHFSEIRVIASGTSFRFQHRDLTMAEIAAEVSANYIVDGSVRLNGQKLRIAVQLVDAETGLSLWSDQYDRETEDIFAVQDAMTQMIVAALGVKTQTAELARALRKSPPDLDAYGCLLRARRYTSTLDETMHAEARDLLEKAIELDPYYSDAYALLSNVYLAEHRFDANPRPDPIGRALAMALRATQLDPQNAYARCWLAIVHYFQRDNGKFEAEAKRALDLNPNDPEILADIGHYLSFMGQFARGIALSRRAIQLNPLHPGWYHFGFARLHYHQRRYEDTLVDIQRISMPRFYWTHLLHAATLGQLGRPEAVEAVAMMEKTKPGISAVEVMQKWNTSPEDLDHLLGGLRKAGHEF